MSSRTARHQENSLRSYTVVVGADWCSAVRGMAGMALLHSATAIASFRSGYQDARCLVYRSNGAGQRQVEGVHGAHRGTLGGRSHWRQGTRRSAAL